MSRTIKMPSISYVVARSWPDNFIGFENRLPWSLRSDLKRFREITTGHVVIMGRNTHESIGRALPNRNNIILSRNPINQNDDTLWNLKETSVHWVSSHEDALFAADVISIIKGMKEIFVIGGENMYSTFGGIVNKIYLTEVLSEEIHGDAKFNMNFDMRLWRSVKEQEFPKTEFDQYPTKFSIIERRTKVVRQRNINDFYVNSEQESDLKKLLKNQKNKKNINGIIYSNRNDIRRQTQKLLSAEQEIRKAIK